MLVPLIDEKPPVCKKQGAFCSFNMRDESSSFIYMKKRLRNG